MRLCIYFLIVPESVNSLMLNQNGFGIDVSWDEVSLTEILKFYLFSSHLPLCFFLY